MIRLVIVNVGVLKSNLNRKEARCLIAEVITSGSCIILATCLGNHVTGVHYIPPVRGAVGFRMVFFPFLIPSANGLGMCG